LCYGLDTSEFDPLTGSCEQHNEPWVSLKLGIFLPEPVSASEEKIGFMELENFSDR
jgi:hypothetical protein